jgi:hypothetical protein
MKRVISGYRKIDERLEIELELPAIPLHELQALYNRPSTDPMIAVHDIDERYRAYFERLLGITFDFGSYICQMDSYADPSKDS